MTPDDQQRYRIYQLEAELIPLAADANGTAANYATIQCRCPPECKPIGIAPAILSRDLVTQQSHLSSFFFIVHQQLCCMMNDLHSRLVFEQVHLFLYSTAV